MSTRHLSLTFAAFICAAVIGACGSSSPSPSAGPTGGPLLALAECMRSHGVPNFPDPAARGGLIVPNDIDPQSPAFESAQQACARLAQGPPGGPGASESRKLELLTLARCMRAHRIANFPDPTSSPPPPTSGNALGGDGWYLALGTPQERRTPAYKGAAAACGVDF
jgi:hypothetical protein